MNDNYKLLEKLKEYEQEHLDLDQILIQLQEKHTVDFLQIQRLKKRKLILKDKISHIQNELEPDSIAMISTGSVFSNIVAPRLSN